jgi:hypothetical protein
MKKRSVSTSFVLLIIVIFVSGAFAQQPLEFQYAVKFICGTSPGKVLAKGSYRTAINVHNPAETEVVFRKKFASSLAGEKPGPITPWMKGMLGPDQALEIDCGDPILKEVTTGTFIKGFVVIESNSELDVVAVYTAAGRDGDVRALEVECVGVRHLAKR